MHPPLLAQAQYDEETIENFNGRYSGFGKNFYGLLKEKIPFLYDNLFFYKIKNHQADDSFAVYGNGDRSFAIQLCPLSQVIVLWNKGKHVEIGTWSESPEEEALQRIINIFYLQEIEIKQHKKPLILGSFFTAVIGTVIICSMLLFADDLSLLNQLLCIGFAFYMIYSAYKTINFSSKNIAVLNFSRESLTINDNEKPITFLWTEIISYNIQLYENEDHSETNLIVNTKNNCKSVVVSVLEKSPAEIEKLIAEYKTASNTTSSSKK